MKKAKIFLLVATALVFSFIFTGCFDDGLCSIKVNNPEHATIVLNQTEIEQGKFVLFDIECEAGYEVDYVIINDEILDTSVLYVGYKVNKDITISCVVKPSIFNIGYLNITDAEFEKPKTTFSVTDQTFQLPSPTKIGAEFDGWYIDEQKVTEFNPSQYTNDIYLYASWKEYFNFSTTRDSWTGEYYKTITSLTEYGKTLKNLEIPHFVGEMPVKSITALQEDDEDKICFDNIKLNKFITDLPDEVWASVKNISFSNENEYLIQEGDFIYFVSDGEKVLRFINNDFFVENNQTLYIESDVTGIEIFYLPNAVSKIKRFMVDNQNEVLNVKSSQNYSAIAEKSGFTQGNVLYKGDDIVRYIPFGETSFTIASTVATIYDYAFKDCSNLKEITFEVEEVVSDANTTYKGTKYINRNAFEGCKFIRTISLPKTLFEIDHYAFKNCYDLIEISGLTQSKLDYLGVGVFTNTNLYTITLPSTMKGRGNFYKQNVASAFVGSKIVRVSLSSVLESDVDNILKGTRYFQEGSFIIDGDFVFLGIKDENYNTNYKYNSCKLIAYLGTEETIILPEVITITGAPWNGKYQYIDYTIDTDFLFHNQYVKNVHLKATSYNSYVKTINYRAFNSCYKLESLMFYEGCEISSTAVYNCEKLKTVYVYRSYSILQENMDENWISNADGINFIDYGTEYKGKVVWKKDSEGNIQLITQ